MAQIAPAVLHPVEEIHVTAGQRVKKGQLLVKIDDDEYLIMKESDVMGVLVETEARRKAA